ncbi:MAG: elongation factor G [Clostridia bacterium]|nr:elongation factor G [Clostridia bacterium]
MDKITTKSIRNVALLGHGGSGKTSLCEAMLYLAKETDRLGRTPEGNTVSDYDPEEIRRGFSLSTTATPLAWQDSKINIIDTPGYLDFTGEVLEGMRVADSALIVVDGRSGVEVGTELAWDMAEKEGIPKAFFINRFDDGEARFKRVFDSLREKFGVTVCPLLIPMIEGDKVIGFLNLIDMKAEVYDKSGSNMVSEIPEEFKAIAEEYRNMLYESIAQTSDDLMDKFFNEEPITYNEAMNAVHDGIINGEIVPVFCGSATKMWGVTAVLDTIANSFPRPTARKTETIITDDGEDKIAIDPEGETSLFVFKTVADPFVGKMSFFKVMNGSLNRDAALRNTTTGATEKMARIYTMRGKKQNEVDHLCCGDIGMTAKLAATNTGDTLTASAKDIRYRGIAFPEPFLTQAIKPLAKGDEDKISSGIAKLLEEDLTIRYENNAETKQLLISGVGDIHLDVLVAKLKNRFGTSVVLDKPKIAYRETIKKTVEAEGKHKKQSGGHGQYGHVRIKFSPSDADGLTFTESVVGGAVPKGFFPAVEKGLLEAMQKGVLAGYPVVGLAADLYDGSYHDVDSSEMSFKMAASLAYKEGLPKANPVLLEPVGSLNCLVPDNMVGDVIGDLNKRRGRVLGMEASHDKKGYTNVQAEVPKAEMMDYPIALRATTQGRGSFTFYFERYEEVPANVAQKVIADAANAE